MTAAKTTGLVTIEAKAREVRGKGGCRKIRAQGLLPANVSALGKSVPITLDPKHLPRVVREMDGRFLLSVGGHTREVKVQELQLEAVSRRPLHVDLLYVG